jgi:DnaK suppressor protein
MDNRNGLTKHLNSLEQELRTRLTGLTNHVANLREEMLVEDDVDDEATQAFRSSSRDLIMLTLEREIRNISEIEQALERIKNHQYGVCVSCDEKIPYNRMRAIPWTRMCVDCAGGGMNENRARGAFSGQQSLAFP